MKKKVLFVIHHLTIGGAQKSLTTALRYFDYDKYDVTLYIRKKRLDLLPYVDERVHVIVNDDSNHYYRKPYALVIQLLIFISGILRIDSLNKKMKKKLSDFILIEPMKYEKNTYFNDKEYDIAIAFMQGTSALFISDYIDAKKTIVRFCGSTDETPELNKKTLGTADAIICVSDGVREALSSFYPEYKDKIFVIGNIVNSEYIKQSGEEYEVDRADSDFVICSVGRFAKVKGMDFAVNAAKHIRKNGISFRWFMIGDGPETDNLKNLARENDVANEIVFTGMISNPYPYFKACDIFVLPSREEALSNSLLEAYSFGKPVVSTPTVCGINNVTDGVTGIICDMSAEGIAQGVMKLINDDSLRNAIQDNLRNFDNEEAVSRYKKEWQNVLEAI